MMQTLQTVLQFCSIVHNIIPLYYSIIRIMYTSDGDSTKRSSCVDNNDLIV